MSIIAVAVLAALTLLNLALTLGVVRRLREHTELLARANSPGESFFEQMILATGATIGDFAARTTDGAAIERDDLDARTLVGFFSPHCGGCRDRATAFAETAQRLRGGRRSALAVIAAADLEEASDFVRRLDATSQIIVEPDGGPVQSAFKVTGFPAFCVVGEDAVAMASGFELDGLPLDLAAPVEMPPLQAPSPSLA
jgi:hypothetical protein